MKYWFGFCCSCSCCCCCSCCSCCCCLYGCCWSHKPTFQVWLNSGQEQLRYWWYWVCGGGGWWWVVSHPTFELSWGWVGVVTKSIRLQVSYCKYEVAIIRVKTLRFKYMLQVSFWKFYVKSIVLKIWGWSIRLHILGCKYEVKTIRLEILCFKYVLQVSYCKY